jgi:hypothetical protein
MGRPAGPDTHVTGAGGPGWREALACSDHWIGSAGRDPSRRSRCQNDALERLSVYSSRPALAKVGYVVGADGAARAGRRQNIV